MIGESSELERLTRALADRYAIERELGRGGMATVYLARDLKHDREVALKVLRPELSAVIGAERFLAEIRTTANLQHPNILPLFDSGVVDGVAFYVMPFVDGESLRDRLDREKQLSIADAVRIATEIANALDYAHRHGVVHRDVKPENVLLHDGHAVVADFGIALAVSAGGGTRMTETGMSLGTPHYMAPEQAMGEREITARADVYALGATTYEMLVGEPPFTGATAQAIVAKVLTSTPAPIAAQRHTVPAAVEAAVLTALAKLPADRFATAAEFAAALVAPAHATAHTASRSYADARPAAWRWLTDRRTLATLAGAAVLVAAAIVLPRRTAARDGRSVTTRLRLALDDTTRRRVYRSIIHGPPAVAPDGRTVAYAVAEGDTVVLRVQPLDRFDPWVVDGGGRMPFFSPDGRWIGFLRDGGLWKVPTSGGAATPLGTIVENAASWDLPSPGVWLPDGQIYFAGPRGLLVISANGGPVRTVAVHDSAGRGVDLGQLSGAPGGRLLAVLRSDASSHLALLSTDGREVGRLPDDVQKPATFAGDLLVFGRAGQLYASAFDLDAGRPVGEPLPLTDLGADVGQIVSPLASGTSTAWFSDVSQRRVELVWVTRAGVATPVGLPAGDIRWPRLSPDGRRLALLSSQGGVPRSVVDLASGVRSPLQAPSGRTEPTWFRDGTRFITSLQLSRSHFALVVQDADGSRMPDSLLTSNNSLWPTDVAPGDSLVLFYGPVGADQQDVQLLDLRTKQVRRIALPGEQRGARFSPDMRWLALQSREPGGRFEVIVLPWPSLDARHVVSTDGGEEPIWSRDGRELFYRRGGHVMVVRVSPGASWVSSPPSELLSGPFESDLYGDQSWDVAPDGRFLMVRAVGESRLGIRVIQNWAAELARKLADGRSR